MRATCSTRFAYRRSSFIERVIAPSGSSMAGTSPSAFRAPKYVEGTVGPLPATRQVLGAGSYDEGLIDNLATPMYGAATISRWQDMPLRLVRASRSTQPDMLFMHRLRLVTLVPPPTRRRSDSLWILGTASSQEIHDWNNAARLHPGADKG